MAQYLMLVYENETGWQDASPGDYQQAMEAHGRFARQVGELGGELFGGNALQPTTTATR
jgi:hypothetical protein